MTKERNLEGLMQCLEAGYYIKISKNEDNYLVASIEKMRNGKLDNEIRVSMIGTKIVSILVYLSNRIVNQVRDRKAPLNIQPINLDEVIQKGYNIYIEKLDDEILILLQNNPDYEDVPEFSKHVLMDNIVSGLDKLIMLFNGFDEKGIPIFINESITEQNELSTDTKIRR